MTSNHNRETQSEEAPGGPPGEVAEAVQPDAGAAPQAPAGDHKETLRLLEDARAKADENWDRALRLQAELDNSRKRFERELEGAHKYAIEKFVIELLPVRDSLENALDASRAEQADIATFREGTELTLKMLDQALEKSGVEEIDPLGQRFDPELHQAMSVQPAEGAEPNTVVVVMQKGYTLNGRLVRPALVIVAK
jgi:molecular chaperone GrpE